MDLESVKKFLEGSGNETDSVANSLELRCFSPLVMQGLRVDLIEPGHLICSMKVPPRLLNMGNILHGGATMTLVELVGNAAIHTVGAPNKGVSVEINVSYLDAAYADDEIEIEAKVLQVGKAVRAVNVELRNKITGTILAQGRHTKYLVSKM